MIQEFLTRVKPKQKKYFTELRTGLLAMPEIEESVEIDEFRGDWCPTYRVRGKDLAWVHFEQRLWVSLPVEPTFEKKVLQNENLDEDVVENVKEAEDVGDVKLATVELTSTDAVTSVLPLLKLRHSFLSA
jgi:hypothetical protein